jgi:hypothetical protein
MAAIGGSTVCLDRASTVALLLQEDPETEGALAITYLVRDRPYSAVLSHAFSLN